LKKTKHTHAHTCAHTHTHAYARSHSHTHTQIHTQTHSHICTHANNAYTQNHEPLTSNSRIGVLRRNTNTITHSLSLTHTHAYTHKYTLTHTIYMHKTVRTLAAAVVEEYFEEGVRICA